MALLCQSSPMLADTTHSGVLLGALCDQRAKGLFCDVTIVVEDIKFRAHRNVLAASSGYFRNALASPDVWSSGQVLELMDLRSEVFARILNFIYSSRVALTSVEDVRSLVAAGKRLGIPFLERLSVSETSTEQSVPQNPTSISNWTPATPRTHRSRRKTSDSKRGPRITNAFSITDIATGNDPFTPMDLRGGGQQSVASTATSCPTPDSTPSTSETLHTLADHSYAVNMGEGGCASGHSLEPHVPETATNTHPPVLAEAAANTHPPVQVKSAGQASQTCSPLKKRYKLWGNLDENTPGSPAQTPGSAHNVNALTSPSPDSSSPNQKTQLAPASDLPKMAEATLVVSGTPPVLLPLKPSEAALHRRPKTASTPTQRHLTRLPGLLFCRFCHRKFMHLKRLRNHEQVCTKHPDLSDGKEEEEEDTVVRAPAFISGPAFTALPSGLSGPPAADLPEMIWEVGTGAGMGAGLGVGGQLGRVPRRMYPCSVCKRAYATVSSLRRHENVHSWQRAYPCHYCNKVFALAEYRTKHEVWHTGERRYQCIFCLETFMTYYILKNHQKSYHGIDPRLSVNRKSANGGFKGSVYPIKLYRLLPMKFRKRRYRSYGRAFSEAPEFGEQAFTDALGSGSSPSAAFREGTDGPPVFATPLTFMATQRMVAPVQPSRAEAEACLRRGGVSPPPSLLHSSTDGPGCTLPELQMHTATTSSPRIHDRDLGDGCLPPDSTSGSGNDPEDRSPTAARPPEDGGRTADGGKIATYIAKPACPGPSSDSRVPPLCQITVKIGNEAIVRRSIAGSNLIPRKKRRHSFPRMEANEAGGGDLIERAAKKQSLHPRAERTRSSLGEAEPGDDGSFCDDADEPWRPYYSYKSKRRAKRLRSRDRIGGKRSRQRMSTDRELTLQGKAYSPEHNFPSDLGNVRVGLQRTTHSCEDCQRAFSCLSALRTHMADCHPKEQVPNCRSCGKRRSLEEVPQDGKEFTCSTCTREGSHLENSAGSPAPDRRYRCSFCPQRFLYLATRRSHERKHLENHGKGQGCQYTPKPPSVAVHQKRHAIKTEEEEVEVQQLEEVDSKAAAREVLKLTVWDDHKLGSPVTLKLEDQTETNGSDCDQGSSRKQDVVALELKP